MKKFEALFGIKSASVKKNCIMCPLLPKGILDEFRIKDFKRGKLYSSGNSDTVTLIQTGIGPGFAGDAVLYLKETACKNIILFGSCGLVKAKKGLSIGSLVCPAKCYANESFSEMLLNRKLGPRVFHCHEDLLKIFLRAAWKEKVEEVTCATLSSLKLEEDMLHILAKKNIDVVDMECSAFFSAAAFVNIRVIALFYITDIIHKKPFYCNLETELKSKLTYAVKTASLLLKEILENSLSK